MVRMKSELWAEVDKLRLQQVDVTSKHFEAWM